MIIVSSWPNQLGIAMGLWHYHREVLPFMSANFPRNFSLLPATVMFLNQYKPEPADKGSPIWGFSAFVAEPISQMADLYYSIHWKQYLFISDLCRAISAGFEHRQAGR
ncbi:CBO0543 family protein [Insulibacter thermoxylanivorax]|uniref:CBO0543 family protein n=1 Tax=Insulibacter thermoxylanivorax TaxID=2749268 RepID=UPI001F5BE4B2|nr:CBO0543 family protein [Insulibacter thermoxylanivorax]